MRRKGTDRYPHPTGQWTWQRPKVAAGGGLPIKLKQSSSGSIKLMAQSKVQTFNLKSRHESRRIPKLKSESEFNDKEKGLVPYL